MVKTKLTRYFICINLSSMHIISGWDWSANCTLVQISERNDNTTYEETLAEIVMNTNFLADAVIKTKYKFMLQ